MGRILYNENGEAVEVMSDEEIAALKESSTKLTEYEQKLKDLEEAANPNWKKARETIDNLKTAIKATGKDVDDDGNIIDNRQMSNEEVARMAREAARSELLNERKKSILRGLPQEKREVAEHYFNKLSSGEELDIEKIDRIMADALRIASPGEDVSIPTAFNGLPPKVDNERKEDFADTDAGKEISKRLGLTPLPETK